MLQYVNIIVVLLDFCVLFAWSVWNRHNRRSCLFILIFHVRNYPVDFDDSWCWESALNAVRQISFWPGLSTELHNINLILHKNQILFHKFSKLYRWQNTNLIKTSLVFSYVPMLMNTRNVIGRAVHLDGPWLNRKVNMVCKIRESVFGKWVCIFKVHFPLLLCMTF